MQHLYEQQQRDSETLDRQAGHTQPPAGQGKETSEQKAEFLMGVDYYTGQYHEEDDNEEEDFLDEEAQKLYEWTQELSMEEVTATPRISTVQLGAGTTYYC